MNSIHPPQIRTLSQENNRDMIEITTLTPPQKFIVNGRHVSLNGREELLYIQGHYPTIGYINNRSIKGKETILHVQRTAPSQVVYDEKTKSNKFVQSSDTAITPEVAGTVLSYDGRHILIYLKGTYPELGEIHTNGYTGVETIVKVLPEFTMIPIEPAHFEKVRAQFGDIATQI